MAEYYSKEQLLESGRTTWCDMYDLEDFLNEIPAENVLQITRCKDCKYYKRDFVIIVNGLMVIFQSMSKKPIFVVMAHHKMMR